MQLNELWKMLILEIKLREEKGLIIDEYSLVQRYKKFRKNI